MPLGNQPPKEFRASLRNSTAKLSYAEKLQDVRWKRKRDDLLRASGYTCCECGDARSTQREPSGERNLRGDGGRASGDGVPAVTGRDAGPEAGRGPMGTGSATTEVMPGGSRGFAAAIPDPMDCYSLPPPEPDTGELTI